MWRPCHPMTAPRASGSQWGVAAASQYGRVSGPSAPIDRRAAAASSSPPAAPPAPRSPNSSLHHEATYAAALSTVSSV